MQPTRNTLSENIRARSVEHPAAAIDPHGQVKQAARGIDQQLWFVESHVAPVNGHDA